MRRCVNSDEESISLIDIIKEELECNSYVYLASSKYKNALVVEIVINDFNMRIYFFAYDKKINVRLVFPFVAERDMIPTVALFLLEYRDKAFSNLRLDSDKGTFFFDYSYLVRPNEFDSEFFWIYVRSMTSEACRLYKLLNQMSVGIIDDDLRKRYKAMLASALERLRIGDS